VPTRLGHVETSDTGLIVNKTELALLARGIDRHRARKLRDKGWDLASLRSASNQKLSGLGLRKTQVAELKAGGRSPIPNDTLIAVLFANRYACCVCRNGNASIVVHHIRPWASSKDHKSSNLAVICLTCHDKAHTKSTLSLNLTPQRLREFKKLWEKEVRSLDPQAILDAARVNYSAWYYFNHLRLFELAQRLGISARSLSEYPPVASLGLVDAAGRVRRDAGAHYMYEGGFGIQLYAYTKELMDTVLQGIRVDNISDFLNRGTLPNIVKPGDFIYVQGAHVFSSDKSGSAASDTAIGKRKANGIEVRYAFDRREATSNSAWSSWLRGRQDVGSLVQLKKVMSEAKKIILHGTVFGICAALQGLKKRHYDQSLWQSGLPHRDQFEFEEL